MQDLAHKHRFDYKLVDAPEVRTARYARSQSAGENSIGVRMDEGNISLTNQANE